MPSRSGSFTLRYRPIPAVFDADSDFDVCLARLSVLYEDLRFELMTASRTDDDAERTYFIRRSVGTLREFVECLEWLNGLAEFAAVKRGFNKFQRGEWNSALAFLSQEKKRIYDERNAFGGHFSHGAAKAAIRHSDRSAGYSLEIQWVSGGHTPQSARLRYAETLSTLALVSQKHDGDNVRDYTQNMLDMFMRANEKAIACVNILVDHVLGPRFGF